MAAGGAPAVTCSPSVRPSVRPPRPHLRGTRPRPCLRATRPLSLQQLGGLGEGVAPAPLARQSAAQPRGGSAGCAPRTAIARWAGPLAPERAAPARSPGVAERPSQRPPSPRFQAAPGSRGEPRGSPYPAGGEDLPVALLLRRQGRELLRGEHALAAADPSPLWPPPHPSLPRSLTNCVHPPPAQTHLRGGLRILSALQTPPPRSSTQ